MRKLIAVLICTLSLGGGASWIVLQLEDRPVETDAIIAATPAPPATPAIQPLHDNGEHFLPLRMPETGYSGTMEARATRDADEAEARPGARPAPPARPAWDRYAPDHPNDETRHG